MDAEPPAIVCIVNQSEVTILGRLRDGRMRTIVVTAANGDRTAAREPLWQAPLPRLAPGETGCVEGSAGTLVRPVINVWTTRPTHILFNGREDYADCRLPRPLTAGVTLTYTYAAGLLGRGCRRTETR
jgi:hypothetical protein